MSQKLRIADLPGFKPPGRLVKPPVTEPHPWDLPPEAAYDEGWDAAEWQPYADAFEYRLGPFTLDEIIAQELGDAGR